jgi:pentose-5-phosphate-3-epimerase
MYIIPAIYPEIFEEVLDKSYIISDVTDFVQIVLCDGSYGMRVSWLPTGREILPSTFKYQFDCILTSWREYVVKAYRMGVTSIVIHVDEFTDADYDELFTIIHNYDFTLGITVSNEISVDVLINAVKKIEASKLFPDMSKVFIQVTAMRHLEENNHPFDERVLHRIRVLKKLLPQQPIQVGGRITPETARLVRQAGGDILVVGTYLFGQESVEVALQKLIEAITEELKPPATEAEKKIVENAPSFQNASHATPPQQQKKETLTLSPTTVSTKMKDMSSYKASDNEIVYVSEEDTLRSE